MAHAHHIKRRAISGEGTTIIIARALYVVFTIIIIVIITRMALLMLGVGRVEPLAQTLYMLSSIFLAPFFLLFGYTPTYGAPVFEICSLIAIPTYILLGWGLAFLVTMGSWHSDEV